ncbi:MAG: 30S ribosomal protein S16 [bacterium]|nr:30S ribosomal protein S16 [bacterium]
MIRLQPVGKRGQKTFRVIVSEKSQDVYGRYVELLGSYNPHPTPPEASLKSDRIKYWIEKGAQPSPTVHNLLIDQKIITGEKVMSWKPKVKKGEDAGATSTETAPKAEEQVAPKKEEKQETQAVEVEAQSEEKKEVKAEEVKPATEAKPEMPKDEAKPEKKTEEKPEEKQG